MDTEGALGQHLVNTCAGHRSQDPDCEPNTVLGKSLDRAEVHTSVFHM